MRLVISGLAVALALVLAPAGAGLGSVGHRPAAGQVETSQQRASGLVLWPGSWGPLKLGMRHKRTFTTGMVSKKLDRCAPGYRMTKRFRERGFVVWRGDFPKMRVRNIVIVGSLDHTAKGIRVGSTLRRLRKAYPGLSRVRSASAMQQRRTSAADLYSAHVKGPRGTLNFQFAYGPRPRPRSKIAAIVLAPRPTVWWGC